MKTIQSVFLFAISFIFMVQSYGQETRFFMPSEIQQAYEKGTRAWDGNPGENYWQNTVDYKIKVKVIPEAKMLDGTAEIIYYNNSPNEINDLVVRLYGDVYKKGNARAYALPEDDINEGVTLSEVMINDISYDLDNRKEVEKDETNTIFHLKEPLQPGKQLTFRAGWKQQIPSPSTWRMGAYDSTCFFVAYWYPQISVYDDLFGWDRIHYTALTEFYNNLARFDVEITVPENFVVLATGTLQNAEEILPESILKKYKKAKTSEDIVPIISMKDIENGYSSLHYTWHYTANDVTDFAFATSDHYAWDAAAQKVGNKYVLVSTFHPADTNEDYIQNVEVQRKAMKHFSENIPGIPYPYEAFTTMINGRGGGMEFPMMANNGNTSQTTAVHEMFHTYFPMYVRTNEQIWAWMDEGWAVYNTALVEDRYINKTDEKDRHYFNSWGSFQGINDLPIIMPSHYLTWKNYGTNSYSKPSVLYAIIHDYLGEELFVTCYREYIRRWAHKAPSPYDFFYTFEDVSGQNLAWLWKPWIFDYAFADLEVVSFENNMLEIHNKGTKPVPVIAEVLYIDGDTVFVKETAGVWKGKEKVFLSVERGNEVEKITVNQNVMDEELVDNFFPSMDAIYESTPYSDHIFGKFRFEEFNRHFFIEKEKGKVYYNYPLRDLRSLLYPIDENVFSSLNGNYQLHFQFDEAGNCTGIHFESWRLFKCVKVE